MSFGRKRSLDRRPAKTEMSVARGEVFPLLEAKQPLLSLGHVLIEAMFRAELLVRKSVPDKAEKAFAYLASRFCSAPPRSRFVGRGNVRRLVVSAI
jgi:hypothetical protein